MINEYFPVAKSLLLRSATILSPLVHLFEKYIYKNIKVAGTQQHVFIVGSPRSGSTVLYQILTHSLECLYIDNLAYCFQNNLPFGIWLSRKLYRNTSHSNFVSKHGNTRSFHSPSECAGYWNRWFKQGEDFCEYRKDESYKYKSLIADFYNMSAKYDSAFIIKNLSNSQRISVLSNCFPNSKFIYIQRDPLYTIQSLYKARQDASIPETRWWSVKPKNFDELYNLPIIKKLVAQVYFNELQIHEDLKNIQVDKKMVVNFVDYGKKYTELLEFTQMPIIRNLNAAEFMFENRITADIELLQKITTEIEKYSWKEIGYDL